MIEIKNIEQSDLPLMVEIWNVFTDVLSSSNKSHTIGSLTTWYQTRHETNHEYYGCYIDGKLQGFMILKHNEDELIIKMTAIQPQFQSLGYGRRLVYFALKEAGDLPVFTEVKVKNYDVLNSLITAGFKITEFNNESYTLKSSLKNIDDIKDW